MNQFYRLVWLQHVLHSRWVVNQYVRIVPSHHNIMPISAVMIPVVIVGLVFFLLRGVLHYLLSIGVDPTFETVQCLVAVGFFLLMIRWITDDYRSVYLRAFHSRDVPMLIGYGCRPVSIQLAKLVDVYFLSVFLFTYPFLIGGTLAWNQAFDAKIPWLWVTFDFFIICFIALSLRMLIMTLHFRLQIRYHNAQKYGWIASLLQKIAGYLIVGGFGYLIVLALRYWFGGGVSWQHVSAWIGLIDWREVVAVLPTYWLFNGDRWAGAGVALFGLLCVAVWHRYGADTMLKNRTMTTNAQAAGMWGVRLLKRASVKEWHPLVVKDVILMVRNYQVVLPQLHLLFLLLSGGAGMGIGFRQLGFFDSIAVSFSGVFLTQLGVAFFAGALISRVSSVDAEGSMISLLLVNMQPPRHLLVSKLTIHFCFVFAAIILSTLLFGSLMKLSIPMFGGTLISGALIALISTLSYILASAIFPRFNWEDESRIGTSSKANLLDMAIMRTYEFINSMALAISGAFLYTGRITEVDFFLYSFLSIICSSVIWVLTLLYFVRQPWWKRWRA